MTRAEAIEVAASRLEVLLGLTHWKALNAAEPILDALLEAGMTFGEEPRVQHLDAHGAALRFPTVYGRPQGESK